MEHLNTIQGVGAIDVADKVFCNGSYRIDPYRRGSLSEAHGTFIAEDNTSLWGLIDERNVGLKLSSGERVKILVTETSDGFIEFTVKGDAVRDL